MGDTRQKVILVEDNMAEAKLTSIAFSSHPDRPEIVHCTNGESFLQLLESFPLRSILYILLDLNMPRMNGIDVLKTIQDHQEWKRLPVIVFTSSAFQKDILTCFDLGANAYVVKPVEYDELDRKLTAINNFWAAANRLPNFNNYSTVQ